MAWLFSSVTNSPTAGSGNGACQPPWAKAPLVSSSGPPGACITPSSVRNVCTVSFMSVQTPWHADSERSSGAAGAEPADQRGGQTRIGRLTGPGDVTVRADQHGRRRGAPAQHRKLPRAVAGGVDGADTVRPRPDVEAAGPAESEQHRPGGVQQGEHGGRTVGGPQVEVGHPPPDQRVP